MTPGVLSALIVVPLAGAVCVSALDARAERTLRISGLLVTLLAFVLAGSVWMRFAPGTAALQFEERAAWVPGLGLGYHLGLDGLSVSLVALTALLFPLALAAIRVRDGFKALVVTVLLLEAGLLGTFLAQDLVLFYVFWEAMLIPMYFLIALWGGPARGPAAIKFFLYTMAGSVLMLVAIIAVYLAGGQVLGTPTFDLPALLARPLGLTAGAQAAFFGAFAVAFAIKMPVWPLHAWLPDAYAEAPPVVTVLLAGLMAKAGAYGLLRFCLPLFPDAARTFGPLLSVLAVIGILYGGAIAWTQGDMRRLLAYGSMSHMGFILLGIFALDVPAVQGSLIQMVNHGVSTGALFLLAAFLLDRTGEARTDAYGGAAAVIPAFAAAALIVVLSSVALPGTNGFIGEFLILLGTFQVHPASAAFAVLGVVVTAAYLLAFVGRVFHGPVRDGLRELPDLRLREAVILAPLVLAIFWVGLYPQPLLSRSEATVAAVLGRVGAHSASMEGARNAQTRPPMRSAGAPSRPLGSGEDRSGISTGHPTDRTTRARRPSDSCGTLRFTAPRPSEQECRP